MGVPSLNQVGADSCSDLARYPSELAGIFLSQRRKLLLLKNGPWVCLPKGGLSSAATTDTAGNDSTHSLAYCISPDESCILTTHTQTQRDRHLQAKLRKLANDSCSVDRHARKGMNRSRCARSRTQVFDGSKVTHLTSGRGGGV